MRVVFDGAYGDLKLLDSPNKVLKELGFFKNNRVIDNIYMFERRELILDLCFFPFHHISTFCVS